MSRPVLEPIYPPIEWVPGALSPGVMWLGMRLSLIPSLVRILSVAILGHHAFFMSAPTVSLYGISLYCCVPKQSTHTDTEATRSKQLRLVSLMATWLD